MSMTETILERFKEREKEIKKECERLDAAMEGKRREQEKIQREKLAELTRKRANLDRMKADYHALDATLTAAAIAGDADAAAIGERVKDGQATLAEVLSAKGREGKARAEVQEKLAEAARLIRTLAAEIYQLEKGEAQARVELRYAMTYPGQTQIKKLKAEIEVLEHGIGAVLEDLVGAHYDRDRAEGDCLLCSGKFISGMVWENLDAQGLRDVRLDPRLHEQFLPELEKIIAEVQFKDDNRVRLTLVSGLQTGQGRHELYYRLEIPAGAKITTTSTMTKKGGEKK